MLTFWSKTSNGKAAKDIQIGNRTGKDWLGFGNIHLSERLCALSGGKIFHSVFTSLMQGLSVSGRWKDGYPAGTIF